MENIFKKKYQEKWQWGQSQRWCNSSPAIDIIIMESNVLIRRRRKYVLLNHEHETIAAIYQY